MISLSWNYNGRSYDRFPADEFVNDIKRTIYRQIQEKIERAVAPFTNEVGKITITASPNKFLLEIEDCPDEVKTKIEMALNG